MKKALSLILTMLMMAAITTSCGVGQNNQNNVPPEQTNAGNESKAVQSAPDTSQFIGEERAGEIALERAGLSAEDVIFDRVELDRDNGVWQYEIDFRRGKTEYDVDIKADDGTVISFETDND